MPRQTNTYLIFSSRLSPPPEFIEIFPPEVLDKILGHLTFSDLLVAAGLCHTLYNVADKLVERYLALDPDGNICTSFRVAIKTLHGLELIKKKAISDKVFALIAYPELNMDVVLGITLQNASKLRHLAIGKITTGRFCSMFLSDFGSQNPVFPVLTKLRIHEILESGRRGHFSRAFTFFADAVPNLTDLTLRSTQSESEINLRDLVNLGKLVKLRISIKGRVFAFLLGKSFESLIKLSIQADAITTTDAFDEVFQPGRFPSVTTVNYVAPSVKMANYALSKFQRDLFRSLDVDVSGVNAVNVYVMGGGHVSGRKILKLRGEEDVEVKVFHAETSTFAVPTEEEPQAVLVAPEEEKNKFVLEHFQVIF